MHVVHDLDVIHDQLKSCLNIVVLRELWLLKKSIQSICRAILVIRCYNLQESSNADGSLDLSGQERHLIRKKSFQLLIACLNPFREFYKLKGSK